jgi:replicative DNA helicase|tara:strand:+ start:10043 stop:11827 length:1785 start_codon:yes stop_codon:yes gene_type:complete
MALSLPNSKIAEQVILAHILLNKQETDIIFNRISSDMFYSNDYKIIYQIICDLRENNIQVNFDTVYNSLDTTNNKQTNNDNYLPILTELVNQSGRSGELESYLILLLDKYLRRRLILSIQKISELAYDNSLSLENIFDQAEHLLFDVTQKKPNLGLLPASEVLLETFLDLERRSKEGQLIGVPSGFFDLDLLTQGFQKSDLIIIAGRPSMGKTAFALNIARNVADLQSFPVVIFSLEMSRNQIIYRFLSNESGVNNSKLRSGAINANEWRLVSKAINSLSDLSIYLDDKSDITISDIRTKLANLKSRFSNLGLIIIDYLQLISDTKAKDSRVQELSRITRNLKLLAKEFNVPIIVLSQLSRNVESRTNKRPLLSDLRESGCFAKSTKLYDSFQKTRTASLMFRSNKKLDLLVGIKDLRKKILPIPSNVKSLFSTGYHLMYTIIAFGHYEIKLTKKHKILTQHGWKRIEFLSQLDLISIVDKHNFLWVKSILSYIKMFSFFTFLQINKIAPGSQEIVYDCWLPFTNNFLANGYVLHNSIEQDADLVLMIYRDQYYSNDNNNGITDIIIAKHRNGPVGTVNLLFDSDTASFGSIIN